MKDVRHPRQEAIHQSAQELASRLQDAMPPGVGFTLFLFEMETGGFLSYLSNADRADMIKTIKEWIKVQEAEAKTPVKE